MEFKYDLHDYLSGVVTDLKESTHDSVSLSPLTNRLLCFGNTSFDNYVMFIVEPVLGGAYNAYQVNCLYYYERLYWLGLQSDNNLTLRMIYGHALHLYEMCKKGSSAEVEQEVFMELRELTQVYYGPYSDMAYEAFMMLYYAMISAEQQSGRQDANPLGSAIIVLSLYRLLIEQYPVAKVADSLRGIPFDVLKAECDKIGLVRLF